MITDLEIASLVRQRIPGASVRVSNMTGTHDHFEIEVASSVFSGKSIIEQHRLVMQALEEEMKDRIHAVKIKTKAV